MTLLSATVDNPFAYAASKLFLFKKCKYDSQKQYSHNILQYIHYIYLSNYKICKVGQNTSEKHITKSAQQ